MPWISNQPSISGFSGSFIEHLYHSCDVPFEWEAENIKRRLEGLKLRLRAKQQLSDEFVSMLISSTLLQIDLDPLPF